MGEESCGLEAVDAGVDLGDVELVGLEGFLLDDRRDFGGRGRGAEDAAVADGVGRDGGEDGHGGLLAEMEGAHGLEGGGLDEWDIAGEDEEVFGWGVAGGGDVRFELLEGVARSALLGLEDEGDAGGFDCGADAVGFMANDAVDVVGRRDGPGGCDDVQQEGLTADFVEDFGTAGLEACALARCHDCDSEVGSFHTEIIVSWVRAWVARRLKAAEVEDGGAEAG